MNYIDVKMELRAYIAELRAVNTHCHHYADEFYIDFSLEKLLMNTYLAPKWSDLEFGGSRESRKKFIKKAQFKSYFVWLSRALQDIYDMGEPLNADNWDEYDIRVRAAYKKNPQYHIELLKEKCKYKKVILDAYWNPGDDNGHQELFVPNYRVDYYVNAFSPELEDHNGNTVKKIHGKVFACLDEYESFVRMNIREKLKKCCALKSTLAYDPYGIGFDISASRDAAARALAAGKDASKEEASAFRGYLFNIFCQEAERAGKPFQIHTGLGSLYKSNAMEMLHIIKAYPDVKFSIFHASYPWRDDVAGLLHNCGNVYADLCWLPIISSEAASAVLKEYCQVATSDKLCWGCDTITSEESYGAALAMREAFSKGLADLVCEGYMSLSGAKELLKAILIDNPNLLYGFETD